MPNRAQSSDVHAQASEQHLPTTKDQTQVIRLPPHNPRHDEPLISPEDLLRAKPHIALRCVTRKINMSAPEPSERIRLRARQVQRFHDKGPNCDAKSLITEDHLARARLLQPDPQATTMPDEENWEKSWEQKSGPKSLRGVLTNRNWTALPAGAQDKRQADEAGSVDQRGQEEAGGVEQAERLDVTAPSPGHSPRDMADPGGSPAARRTINRMCDHLGLNRQYVSTEAAPFPWAPLTKRTESTFFGGGPTPSFANLCLSDPAKTTSRRDLAGPGPVQCHDLRHRSAALTRFSLPSRNPANITLTSLQPAPIQCQNLSRRRGTSEAGPTTDGQFTEADVDGFIGFVEREVRKWDKKGRSQGKH